MDDLTLLRDFRAERVADDPEARTAIWRALEARLEAASATLSATPAAPLRRARRAPRRRVLLRRRRVLAFAGAAVAAAAIAGALVLDSGPTAQPAAAQVLHETAAVAASADAPAASPLPGPGQLLYRKFERLELESWVPGGESMRGGRMTRPGAFTALMPTTTEWWTAPDGSGRVREVAGTPRFLTSEERERWEAAGSRLPAPFDPEYQQKYPLAFAGALELGRGVVDTERAKLKGFGFADTSSLPTEPAALRRAVEANAISVRGLNLMFPAAKHLDPEQTTAELLNILVEGEPLRPQLRAAIFNALAEVPGIEVDTDAADSLGRRGYAIRSVDAESGNIAEFIFDPDTAAVLAQRAVLGRPGEGAFLRGLPAGLTISETAYLETAIVDSTRETGAGAEGQAAAGG